MSNKEKWLSLLLVFTTLLTEVHSILLAYDENLKDFKIDAFILLNFKLSVLWYFKQLFDNLLIVAIFFIVCMMKDGFSKQFFKVICINVFYHTFDFVSFVLNYKETYLLYWAVLVVITIWELFIIFDKRNKLKIV